MSKSKEDTPTSPIAKEPYPELAAISLLASTNLDDDDHVLLIDPHKKLDLRPDQALKIDALTNDAITRISVCLRTVDRLTTTFSTFGGIEQEIEDCSVEALQAHINTLEDYYAGLAMVFENLHCVSNIISLDYGEDREVAPLIYEELIARWDLMSTNKDSHLPACSLKSILSEDDSHIQFLEAGSSCEGPYSRISSGFFNQLAKMRHTALRLALKIEKRRLSLLFSKKQDIRGFAPKSELSFQLRNALFFEEKLRTLSEHDATIFNLPASRTVRPFQSGIVAIDRMTDTERLVLSGGKLIGEEPDSKFVALGREWQTIGDGVTLLQATRALGEIYYAMLFYEKSGGVASSLFTDQNLIDAVRNNGFEAYLRETVSFFDQLEPAYRDLVIKIMKSYAHALVSDCLKGGESAEKYSPKTREEVIARLVFLISADISSTETSIHMFQEMESTYTAFRATKKEKANLLSKANWVFDLDTTLERMRSQPYYQTFGEQITRTLILFLEDQYLAGKGITGRVYLSEIALGDDGMSDS